MACGFHSTCVVSYEVSQRRQKITRIQSILTERNNKLLCTF